MRLRQSQSTKHRKCRKYLRLSGCALLLFLGWISSCNFLPALRLPQTTSQSITKKISFAILEDYDKGEDLKEIAKDFELMKELEIDVLRCSFGWDDYEPVRGQYDFAWLREFVKLAAQHGIKLRPYIGYTPRWAGTAGSGDGVDWNNPPADYQAWYDFVYNLASALRGFPNVLSYEIYNEENSPQWWDGSIEEYKETLRQGARAVRAANPQAQVLLGGFVFPDVDWLRSIAQDGYARYYDITPFHAYPETWTESDVVVENYLGRHYRESFVRDNKSLGEAEPIWINEMGFSATPDKTELQQANWWARAVSTFLADAHIEHIGVYEIKDLPLGKDAIGDKKNHYLGIARADRVKKLAFYTLDMLTDLLDVGTITTADGDVTITVSEGKPSELYRHLFKRPDGSQVLFIYDKSANPTVRARLRTRGATALKYELDGSFAEHPTFDGHTLTEIRLTAGNVAIFRIDP
jgi:polysaccharide biosynthesis protein PslG